MKNTALLLVILMVVIASVAQTKLLSVCEIVAHVSDWNNNVVLIQAHYHSGFEDSFLFDEKCPGKEIWLDYPESAAKEDALLNDTQRTKRTFVSLDKDAKFPEFERYASVRDKHNPMCQQLEIEIAAVGRVDTKRGVAPKKNCQPFGMCNYPARFVLATIRQVSAGESMQPCRK